MKIAVFMKQVPAVSEGDTDPETGMLRRQSLEPATNPYDLSALEAALRLKDAYGAEITVFTMGPRRSAALLNDSFAVGADAGVLISDAAFSGADVLATSYTLFQAVKACGGDFDLYLCGSRTTDGDTGQTGGELAARLRIAGILRVCGILSCGKDDITAVNRVGGEVYRFNALLPCLMCVEREAFTLRMPTLRGKLDSRKKQPICLDLKSMPDTDPNHYGLAGSATRVAGTYASVCVRTARPVLKLDGKEAAGLIFKVIAERRKDSGGREILSESKDPRILRAGKDRYKSGGGDGYSSEVLADSKQNQGIMVYVECSGGEVAEVSLELIGEAVRLSSGALPVFAAIVGDGAQNCVPKLFTYRLSGVYVREIPGPFRADIYGKAILSCILQSRAGIVLFGGTDRGHAVASRVAPLLETGLTADCTSLELGEDGGLVQIRPAFGGNLMARIETPKARPQMATVRPGIMDVPKEEIKREIPVYSERTDGISAVEILDVSIAPLPDGLMKTDLIIACGQGVKTRETAGLIKDLARLLGGQAASGRSLVEKGWFPPERQVGLSGQSVSPEILLTFGLSGSVQFTAGIRGAKTIIAVNTDTEAPIMTLADYPICADLNEVVQEMIERTGRKGTENPVNCGEEYRHVDDY